MSDAYDFWAQRLPRDEAREIDRFWERFADRAQELDRHLLGRAPGVDPDRLMREALGPLADRLFWEFGPTGADGQTLAITAELFHSRRALARAVMLRAPRLPGWRFTDQRPPVIRIADAIETVLWRSRADRIQVEAITPQRGAHRQVDLVAAGQGDPEFLADQAGIVFGALLGDVADQNWLGQCQAQVRSGGARFLRRLGQAAGGQPPEAWLDRFRAAAVDVISGFEEERPREPFADSRMTPETLIEFRLNPQADNAERRQDAISYKTRYRPVVAARFAGAPVSSMRFSRYLESFCGLKIRRGEGLAVEDEAALGALAAEIERLMAPAGIGGVTGFGEGLAHVYIDLAIEDMEAAVGILRRALSEAGVTAPTWLLFDEAGLEDRYFPLTSHARATPMAAH